MPFPTCFPTALIIGGDGARSALDIRVRRCRLVPCNMAPSSSSVAVSVGTLAGAPILSALQSLWTAASSSSYSTPSWPDQHPFCLLYTSPSPRDGLLS
eukprot:6176069-Pleurochrysis_carterae.AAC.4